MPYTVGVPAYALPPYSQRVLVLTPLKDAAQFIRRHFRNLRALSYPHALITVAFLDSDSSAQERAAMRTLVEQEFAKSSFAHLFYDAEDFHFAMPKDRHSYAVQLLRRKILAKSRCVN